MEYGAVVVWWVVSAVLAATGLPIAATVLRRLPDRGAGLALPVALAVLFLPIYWIGHLSYGPPVVAAGVVVLAGGAIALSRRRPELRLDRFAESMAVFTAGFLLLVAARAVDPSVLTAGGEKFLDFGLLKSILRASQLPPEDMWFAGEPVRYYYGGHLIAATLTTLTGVPARYAYNLALAGAYGTLLAAAYGLAGSIAAGSGRSYRRGGAAGALLVGLGSNLVAPLQVLLWALPGGIARAVAGGVAASTDLTTAELLDLGRSAATPFYWIPSRVIAGTINEFPLFAFLNGDLHAHMLSTPFLVLVAALAFAYHRTPPGALLERRALVVGAIPPVAGLLAVVNTWSFPTAVGVAGLALLFAPGDPADLLPVRLAAGLPGGSPARRELGRIGAAVLGAAAVAALGVAWALPFFVGPATGASGRSIGLLPDRSSLAGFVLVHGAFLAVFGLSLGTRALESVGRRRARMAALAALAVVIVGLLADAAAVALVVPPLAVAWLLLRRGDAGFEAVLFVAGAGLVLIVEFVFVAEQAGPGRMNTVFKTYMQVWVLWAVGAGAALVGLSPPSVSSADRRRALAAFSALLVVSVSLYGALALGAHFEGASEPTLDATTWARETHPDEWEAIATLDRLPGTPNMASAPGCWCNPIERTRPYRWANAPSSFTGVPTLAGWSHEVGYRGGEPYMERVEDVRTIYTGAPGESAALLREYEVEYVYVGPNERALYGDAPFEGREGLSVLFRNDAVTVYRVDRGALGG